MKQWQEDKVSSTQIRSMEYVLLQLLEESKIDALNSVDDLLVYCADELSKVKQTYLDNKSRECYDGYGKEIETKNICGGYNGL